MNRIEFSESLGMDTVDQVEKLFDQIMAMYNLINGYETVSASGSIMNEGSITFSVTFGNAQEAIDASSALYAECMRLYDNNLYSLNNKKVSDKVVELYMKKL